MKESSTDVRRVRAIRALIGDRLEILIGVDDGIVEAVQAGAVGWIAGLVNAFPRKSIDLYDLAMQARDGQGDRTALEALYAWFLPLLRLDIVPKFVQLIKLAQEMVGMGSTQVRGPRLGLVGAELEEARAVIQHALTHRPAVAAASDYGDRAKEASVPALTTGSDRRLEAQGVSGSSRMRETNSRGTR